MRTASRVMLDRLVQTPLGRKRMPEISLSTVIVSSDAHSVLPERDAASPVIHLRSRRDIACGHHHDSCRGEQVVTRRLAMISGTPHATMR